MDINISDLIKEAGARLRADFEYIKSTNPHFGERGIEAENILIEFLNKHLPKRFAAGSGLVIDKDNNISQQIDTLIYDALNSPVYRKEERVLILPSDNVATAIEVKSKLNKAELTDASKKISSVKKLRITPVTNVDQPVNFSPLIMTKTFGVVFAFESDTSLETLAENLKEINAFLPSEEWIDFIVVLDKGIIGYTVQSPFGQGFPGWLGGACGEDFCIPPFYIHLVKADLGEGTLNRFFYQLMSRLTFFRKRSALGTEVIPGQTNPQCMTLQGYQYNLKKQLVEVETSHEEGNLLKNMVRYNIYKTDDKKFVGQICRMPWQDGCAITYSGLIAPQPFFEPFFRFTKTKGIMMRDISGEPLWISSVLPLNKEDFVKTVEAINLDGKVIVEKDMDDEKDLPWMRGPQTAV